VILELPLWRAHAVPCTDWSTSQTSHRREVRRQLDYEKLVNLVHDETERIRLAVQQHIPPTPTALVASNIKFTDALDRYKELPYDYFRNWDVSGVLEDAKYHC
jgi:hypothetical protein